MTTLRKIGAALICIVMGLSISSCSDDEPDSGSSISIDGVGNNLKLKYCYLIADDDNGSEIIFSSVDLKGSMPKSLAQFSIDINGPLPEGVEKTFSSKQYNLEYTYIPNLKDEDYTGAIGYAWITDMGNMATLKHPGDLTVKREGNKITVSIENYWMVSDGEDGSWGSNDDYSNDEWINGNISYSGKYTVINPDDF